MKYIIADKLNFLMKVTETKNNMLGRALSFDASHISRIRSGQRGLPSSRNFILPAAGYFARAVKTAPQKNVLARRICNGKQWPDSTDEATLLIAEWLSEDVQALDYDTLSRYLNQRDAGRSQLEGGSASAPAATTFYLGNEGKRQCVIRFLTELAAQGDAVTLLLHSEENMEWIYENPQFARQWGQLLLTLLQQGGRIIIVHTMARSYEEMLEAVSKWAPLYAKGTIEAYYYPKLRDTVFRRTRFIAKGKAAIAASTVGDPGENRVNMLTHDPVAVKGMEQEFYDFLPLCRPLTRLFTSANVAHLIPVLEAFRRSGSELLQFHRTPSLLSLPEEVADSFSRRPDCGNFGDFLTDVKRWLFTRGVPPAVADILLLPDIDDVLAGRVQVPLTVLNGVPSLFYTPEEFRLHVQGALQLMERSDTYRVILLHPGAPHPVTGRPVTLSYSIVASLQAGAMLFADNPQPLIYMNEPTITSAFCEYLTGFVKDAAPRAETLAQLRQYLAALEKAMAGH